MSDLPNNLIPDSEQELFDLVWKDDLTGLYNRRFFARYMKQEADWSDGAPPLALAMMDMDNLKRINDRLGHMAGDASLKQIGALFWEHIPKGTYPVRYAGDEFALIMPGVKREEALEVSNALRQAVITDPFDEASLPEGLHPSLSIGVAMFPEDAPMGGDELTEAADKALYYSKRTGKNKVTSAADIAGAEEVSDLEVLSGFPSRKLVGREQAFRTLDEVISLVRDGRNALVLVEGPGGTGKTRLLSEAAHYARERELAVLIERCSAVTREEPYRVIGGLLDAYLRAHPKVLDTVRKKLTSSTRKALTEVIPTLASKAPEAASEDEVGFSDEAPESATPEVTVPEAPPPETATPEGPTAEGAATSAEGAASGAGTSEGQTTEGGSASESGSQGRPTPSGGVRRPPRGRPGETGRFRPMRAGRPPRPKESGRFRRRPRGRPGRPMRRPRPGGSGNFPRVESGAQGRPRPARGARPHRRPTPRPSEAPDPSELEAESSLEAGTEPRAESTAAPRAESTAASGPEQAASSKDPEPVEEARDSVELTIAVFTGLVELLRVLSVERPLMVLLDDFEHCDEPTLEVITRSLNQEGRVLFVAAARGGVEDEEAPYTAFRESLSELPHFRVELEVLDPEQTAELAEHLLEGFRPPHTFQEQIYALSQGNPLFVEGILRHLINTGALNRTRDGWTVEREAPAELPMSLEDLIRGQLKILDRDTALVLSRAAVVGPNFEFNVLRASLPEGMNDGQAMDLVSQAIKAKLLRETGRGQGADYEFASRGVHSASYQGMSADARTRAHEQVAAALSAEGGNHDAALAYHFGKAGDQAKRDRFLEQVRKRRDQIFDPEAIEALGDGHLQRIPEENGEPGAVLSSKVPELAQALATSAKQIRLYPADNVYVVQALEKLGQVLSAALEECERFTLSHRGNALQLNNHALEKELGEGQHQEAVAGIYRSNGIKSLTFVRPVDTDELRALLVECSKHTGQAPIPRHFWGMFAAERDLRSVGILQKTFVLKAQRNRHWRKLRGAQKRIAETHLPLLKDLIRHFMASIEGVRKYPPGSKIVGEALTNLDRTLRQIFHHVPALAIHEGEQATLVINGTSLETRNLGSGSSALLKLLREQRVRGFVLLADVSHRELERLVTQVGKLTAQEAEGDQDPLHEINEDGSLPNVMVGAALFQLARALLGKTTEGVGGTGGILTEPPEDVPEEAPPAPPEAEPAPEEPPEEQDDTDALVPEPVASADLPEGFTWPSDALAQRARRLCELKPEELVQVPDASQFVEVLEELLLARRDRAARVLIERAALNFANEDALARKRAADVFVVCAKRGTQELRGLYFHLVVRRLADALALEADVEVFGRLAECTKIACLERIAEGDWDVAARLISSLKRKRQLRSEAQSQVSKATVQVFLDLLEDPRIGRVFETIETGSQQERRRAARILDLMGEVAVERILRALMETRRDRVESFLIDMLAALVPHSETALHKQLTPFTDPSISKRLLHAAQIIARDATSLLIIGLQNQDHLTQLEAVKVARSVGGQVAQQVLSWALRHGSPAGQLAAVKHLGELARTDATGELLDLVQKSNIVEVQRECCLAFGKLALNRSAQEERVIPVLEKILRPGGILRTEHHVDVRAAAAWALGQMRVVPAAYKALEKALDDRDDRVVLTAKLFLGR